MGSGAGREARPAGLGTCVRKDSGAKSGLRGGGSCHGAGGSPPRPVRRACTGTRRQHSAEHRMDPGDTAVRFPAGRRPRPHAVLWSPARRDAAISPRIVRMGPYGQPVSHAQADFGASRPGTSSLPLDLPHLLGLPDSRRRRIAPQARLFTPPPRRSDCRENLPACSLRSDFGQPASAPSAPPCGRSGCARLDCRARDPAPPPLSRATLRPSFLTPLLLTRLQRPATTASCHGFRRSSS